MKRKKEDRNTKDGTVSMTVSVPTSLHKRMKISAIKADVGLYAHVIKKLLEVFPEERS
jgi:hypothetical protein